MGARGGRQVNARLAGFEGHGRQGTMITQSIQQQARARRGISSTVVTVTIAIVGVLLGAAVPVRDQVRSYRARQSTREELQSLRDASAQFFRDTRRLPAAIAELVVAPADKGWAGPYLPWLETDPIAQLDEYQLDAWSRAYRLDVQGDHMSIASPGEAGQFEDGPELAVQLDATAIRRKETSDALRRINQAIAVYNGQHQFTEPLSPQWSTALDQLVAAHFLPQRKGHEIDGWGHPFIADPVGKSPLVRVASPALDSKP